MAYYYIGFYGSDGWVKYRVELKDVSKDDDKPVITVSFACPTKGDDAFSMTASTAVSILKLSFLVSSDRPFTGMSFRECPAMTLIVHAT